MAIMESKYGALIKNKSHGTSQIYLQTKMTTCAKCVYKLKCKVDGSITCLSTQQGLCYRKKGKL